MDHEPRSEKLERAYAKYHRASKRVQKTIGKASNKLEEMRSLARNGRFDEAEQVLADVQSKVLAALGYLIDPDVPSVDASDLAMRTFFSKSVGHKPTKNAAHMVYVNKVTPVKAERMELRQRVEGMAHEIALGANEVRGGLLTEDVIRTFARRWPSERLGEALADMFDEAFESDRCGTCGRGGASYPRRERALLKFLEIKRSLEPKVIIDVDKLDSMTLEEVKQLQGELVSAMLEELERS